MVLSNSDILRLHSGDALTEVVKHLSQEKINLYAEASGDFNPIHIDEQFAAQTDLGGTIAHGMLILAYVSEMMTLTFGKNWHSTGKLSARFKTPVRSEDTITITGKIDSISRDDNSLNFICTITCHNQQYQTNVQGKATVKVLKS